jgi:TRAP-type C4-dicarboxylate transport system permease small subunit
VRTAYEAGLARVDRASRWLVIVCSALMILIVSVQVLLRYAFNTSIDWSDEVSRLLFVWCMFLAIPLGLREGSHVGIELHCLLHLIALLWRDPVRTSIVNHE